VKSVEANLERELGPNGVYIYSAMLNRKAGTSLQSIPGKQLTRMESRWEQKGDRVYHAHWFAADWRASKFYTKNK